MTGNKEQFLKDIFKKIRPINPYKVIIFGSAITNKFHEDSDIDLVVILNKKGIAKTYKERIENRRTVSKLLRDVRKKIPIDLFVYTKDEWELLKKVVAHFIERLKKKGAFLHETFY